MKEILIIGAFIITIIGCSPDTNIYSDSKLEQKIFNEIESKKDTIDFISFDDFEWDEMMIIHPYAHLENIEKDFNVDLTRIYHTGIEMRDDVSVLVFYQKRKIVKIVEFPLKGDFSENEVKFIKKDESKFEVIRELIMKQEHIQIKLIEK